MPPLSRAPGTDLPLDPFRIEQWLVDPSLDEVSHGATVIKLEPRAMRLLVLLARRQGQVVTTDEILAALKSIGYSGKFVEPSPGE